MHTPTHVHVLYIPGCGCKRYGGTATITGGEGRVVGKGGGEGPRGIWHGELWECEEGSR